MVALHSITPNQLDGLRRAGQKVKLVDVRTPDEFHRGHADIAINIPLARLDPEILARMHTQLEPIFLISREGTRERQACERLRAAGCELAVPVEGGTVAWESAGLPIIRDPEPILLRRAWPTALLLLGAIVLIGFHGHPLAAMVLAMIFADPLLAVFEESRAAGRGGHLSGA